MCRTLLGRSLPASSALRRRETGLRRKSEEYTARNAPKQELKKAMFKARQAPPPANPASAMGSLRVLAGHRA